MFTHLDQKLKQHKRKKPELSEKEYQELRASLCKLGQKKKEKEATLRKAMFTEKEVKIMTVGRGSQAYHYLGSGKIYGRIGEAFGHAMAELNGIKTNKK